MEVDKVNLFGTMGKFLCFGAAGLIFYGYL